MREMTYPDGEVLKYTYDSGGLLYHAEGTKRANRYVYVGKLWYDEFGQRTRIEYGNGVYTRYTYDDATRRLKNLYTMALDNKASRVIQNIDYTYDLVGNIMSTDNTSVPFPPGGTYGGKTYQSYTYDDLYQLRTGDGWFQSADNKKTTYSNHVYYDIIGNITNKVQTHLIVHGTDSATNPRETNYSLTYQYQTGGSAKPHAVTETEDKLYKYDANGNMTDWVSKVSGQNRHITWNEENRVKSIMDQGSTIVFLYDDSGERAVKRGQMGETVYVNRFYSLKNGGLGSKHVFAGETRVVTKLEKDGGNISTGVPGSIALDRSQGIMNGYSSGGGAKRGINRRLPNPDGTYNTVNPPLEKFEFFYHGDHLGSSNMITDDAGAVYEHLEYFPYGETWVEEGGNSGNTPGYKFTGKELDPETGLYYFGARYYDPVLSKWVSADPALGKFLPTGNKRRDQGLPGMGGVYKPVNLNLYHYAGNNPIILFDPDGEKTVWLEGAGSEKSSRAYSMPIIQKMAEQGIKNPVWLNFKHAEGVLNQAGRAFEAVTGVGITKSDIAAIKKTYDRSDGQFNLVGYCLGGERAAKAALSLANEGKTVDNLVLIGTPLADDSKLFKSILENPNIKNVTRYTIEGDFIANDKGNFDLKEFSSYVKSGGSSYEDLPHFYFTTNKEGQQDWLVNSLKEDGLK